MGRVAFVFPGQGSQYVGMGKAAFDASDAARAAFETADQVLAEDVSPSVSRLCFEGPDDALRLTANTQPAVVATSIAIYRALGETPDVAAGHSLGEYSAHVVAGTLSFSDALRTVRSRGRFMQDAVPVGDGAMSAVMKADAGVVREVCAETEGVVEPANFNSPGQIVIAGAAAAVAAASATLKARGARTISLPVSAPFHSSLMAPAEEALAPVLAAVPFAPPSVPVYVNVDAAPVETANAAKDALLRQVSRPVRWVESVERMVAEGVTLFVEVGPGKVLTGLIGRIAKGVERVHVDGPERIEAAREAIARAKSV